MAKATTAKKRLKSGEPRSIKHVCEHCGQAWVEWRRSLDTNILGGLIRLAKMGGGPARLLTDGFTHGEYTNLQRAQKWGLVEQGKAEDGKLMKKGWWQLTAKGWEFLFLEIKVPLSAWTYKGNLLRLSGPEVSAADVVDTFIMPTWRPRLAP